MNFILIFRHDGHEFHVGLFAPQAVVHMDGHNMGYVFKGSGKWQTWGTMLEPYAEQLISYRLEAQPKFRWRLPEHIRVHIQWAKYDRDENLLRICINLDKISFARFERGLAEHKVKTDVTVMLVSTKYVEKYLIAILG